MDGAKGGKKRYSKRRQLRRGRRRQDDDDEDEEEESPGVAIHWYVIGLSILLVVGLSFVNFLALPEARSHLFRHRALGVALGSAPIHHSAAVKLGNDGELTVVTDGVHIQGDAQALEQLEQVAAAKPALRGSQQALADRAEPATLPPAAPPVVAAPVPPKPKKAASLSGRAKAALGASTARGMAQFDGETWMEMDAVLDAAEISFGAEIFLPNVPADAFPVSSASMKTVAATKVPGCQNTGAPSHGWALFVHEWGTTNRQLRLSWTDGSSACHELFSDSVLVPYDRWVPVGFALSKELNRAMLFIDGQVAADTVDGIGSYVVQSRPTGLRDASIRSRNVAETGPFYIGSHRSPQEDPGNLHGFLGYFSGARLLHHAAPNAQSMMKLLSATTEELQSLIEDGTAPASALALEMKIHTPPENFAENAVDGTRLKAMRPAGSPGFGPSIPFEAWTAKPKHKLFQSAAIEEAGPPGPTLDPAALKATWPKAWTDNFSEDVLRESQKEADAWADEVRDAMRHTWRGYRQRAWGHDEVKPGSGGNKDWCRLAVTMLDALSTLWMMGLTHEFDEAQEWLRLNPLPSPGSHGRHSFFEITIRALGGLLSAYSLSDRRIFLENAVRIADKMMPAFATASGMPMSTVDVGTGDAGNHGWVQNTILAEATTLQVEFRFLSHASGDPKYAAAADKAMNSVLQGAGGAGLIPIYLSNNGPVPGFASSRISFGAMGDSYYEYLLKQWIQAGKKDAHLIEAWKRSMREMMDQLVMTTRGGLTFIAEKEGGAIRARMDHLACFVAGMLIMGARTLPPNEVDPRWEQVAKDLTRTCYEMYKRSPSGLSPEYAVFNMDAGEGHDMSVPFDAPHYLLRPEAAEAIYYMWYYTGDPKYRRWAYEMFSAIKKHCKAKFGFSSVGDVRRVPPPQQDSQESFWLAETLKYFYLIFSPRSTLSLEEFVLNTEAQPLRAWS